MSSANLAKLSRVEGFFISTTLTTQLVVWWRLRPSCIYVIAVHHDNIGVPITLRIHPRICSWWIGNRQWICVCRTQQRFAFVWRLCTWCGIGSLYPLKQKQWQYRAPRNSYDTHGCWPCSPWKGWKCGPMTFGMCVIPHNGWATLDRNDKWVLWRSIPGLHILWRFVDVID